MNQEEKILEFDQIKEKWMEFAVTEKARQEIRESVPILSESMLMSRLRETTEARQLLETCGNPPLVSMDGMEVFLRIASRGECLSAGQLEQVKLALVAVKRLISYRERGKAYDNSLAYYAEKCLQTAEKLSESGGNELIIRQIITAAKGTALLNSAGALLLSDGDFSEWKKEADKWLKEYKEGWLLGNKPSELYVIEEFINSIPSTGH